MRCVDVNVLVHAHRADLPEHARYRDALERMANDDEPLGIPDAVLAGFLRVLTNRRIFREPTAPADAWAAADRLLAAPAARLIVAGDRHWGHFRRLAREIDARGNDLADAHLAAYAAENGATWISADRGFARFPGLRWRHPLDAG
jgi:uncharacterized protein